MKKTVGEKKNSYLQIPVSTSDRQRNRRKKKKKQGRKRQFQWCVKLFLINSIEATSLKEGQTLSHNYSKIRIVRKDLAVMSCRTCNYEKR